jgi:D-alanyl-D-alanine endopeptidase (penicillin-binding protein 7)
MVKYLRKTLLASVLCTAIGCGATPAVTAKAWLVADEKGNILEGVHTTDVRSIASISKLMTVMVVLDAGQSLTEVIPVKMYGKEHDRQTLIDLAIVKSDNQAARLICEYYPGGFSACISAMNRKAVELDMMNTRFADPTGLTVMNVSTAEDLIKLVMSASTYPKIVEASNKPSVQVPVKKNNLVFHNTNPAVGLRSFLVSKTGFINRSGGCIVMMLNTINGIRTVVLLGSKNTKTRIPEAILLAKI